jgi:hypothetical protein
MTGVRATKVAIVVSHPIQHFVHLYRALSNLQGLSVRVFFCSRMGVKPYFDKDMSTVISWADDMTAGFDHVFFQKRIISEARVFAPSTTQPSPQR